MLQLRKLRFPYYRHEDEFIQKYRATLAENTRSKFDRHVQCEKYYARIRRRGKLI